MIRVAMDTQKPLRLILTARCRRCEWCLKQRRNLWWLRARAEYEAASRTWFGTMTLNPDMHYRVQSIVDLDLKSQGIDIDALSVDEQFAERHRVVSRWITKYLKRVRKQSGARLRYMLVAEPHKSGLPHYHCLIHEASPDDVVTERLLRKTWKYGHSKFKLVESKAAAAYVTKYLTKTATVRVRASLRYGTPTGLLENEMNVKGPTPNNPTTVERTDQWQDHN